MKVSFMAGSRKQWHSSSLGLGQLTYHTKRYLSDKTIEDKCSLFLSFTTKYKIPECISYLVGGEPKKLDNQEYTANVPFSFILISHVLLFVTPWTVAYQAPLSMGFSRQGYWSGLPFPSPWYLPNQGIEPRSPAFQALYHLNHQGSP